MSSLPSPSTPPPDQVLDHTSSVPPPPILHRTSPPTVSRTNNMSTSEQQSASPTNAAALESTRSTQAGFPFLSLPPEIRNMIYHHIFTPVKDGTCWRIHRDLDGNHLQGVRSSCFLCRSPVTQIHTTCRAEYNSVKGMYFSFELSGNFMHVGILQTCNTVLNEALPISLAGIHINIVCYEYSTASLSRSLKVFLTYMRQPKGAYFSVFTFTHGRAHAGNGTNVAPFSQVLNGLGIRIGRLILRDITSMTNDNIGKYFATNLDRLENKPAKVEWKQSSYRTSPQYEDERYNFNEAANNWLAQLAKVKAADPDVPMPLLRDFLPQVFEDLG